MVGGGHWDGTTAFNYSPVINHMMSQFKDIVLSVGQSLGFQDDQKQRPDLGGPSVMSKANLFPSSKTSAPLGS